MVFVFLSGYRMEKLSKKEKDFMDMDNSMMIAERCGV